ncbi:NAD(P)-binding domain-containing protein [Crossiella sp. SN42]|uniref:NAD(P)-binding domain-containing protein n=1 Tax=Crossiella sp. SN42 TaxID=2944808 RepID=UPI00207C3893|nr:NAD(P)-binding domain-containing protein [Crossiella sp. SN42]MCO1575088.1 NAD(P)-binding domain-containing protein [Crossiella sp. SN42]
MTTDGPHLLVCTADGAELRTRKVIAATGAFGRPHRPELPGLDTFTGELCHVADYRNPVAYEGKRVIVVGAGNSAVQIAAEPASQAKVTLASRTPVKFTRQCPLGRDLHFWFHLTRVDRLPIGRFFPPNFPQPVLDHGPYRAALATGHPDRREMFSGVNGSTITWPDGHAETVDAIILATGYRPDLPYLASLGVLDRDQRPLHRARVSTVHPGLGFVGLELQRRQASGSRRGCPLRRHSLAAPRGSRRQILTARTVSSCSAGGLRSGTVGQRVPLRTAPPRCPIDCACLATSGPAGCPLATLPRARSGPAGAALVQSGLVGAGQLRFAPGSGSTGPRHRGG